MLLELLGVLAAFVVYKAVRLAVRGQVGAAYSNASRVVHGERMLGIFNELRLQRSVLHRPGLVRAANRYYESAHLPVAGLSLVWLYVRSADGYLYARRTLTLTSAAGMVLHVVFPLAPPRMMTGMGFVDTGSVYGPATYGQDGFFDHVANQIAAMPSLHFGWALIVAVAIVRHGRSRLRWIVLVHPIATALVVVVTANHYWSDVIVAVTLVLVSHAVFAGRRLGRGSTLLPEPEPEPVPRHRPEPACELAA
jgi:hypothetical protein